MELTKRFSFLISIALVVLIWDSFSKMLAVKLLTPFDSYNIGIFSFVNKTNKGIMLGVGPESFPFHFFVLTTIAIVVLCIFVVLKTSRGAAIIGTGLFLGGSLGNFIDRIFRSKQLGEGAVVDFIQVGDLFVFNLADACITCGLILLVWSILVPEKQKRSADTFSDTD